MAQQKALLLASKQGPFAVGTVPIPKPGRGEILVRIQATALNPVDWKIQAYGIFIDKFPAVLGTDIAGTVEELGEGVTGFVNGDRVHVLRSVSRQEHWLIRYVPSTVSLEEASTIPAALATAAIGLFQHNAKSGSVGLYPPWEEGGEGKYSGKPIVVLGGSSSVGQFAIQLAKYAGFSPIVTTASLQNAEWLKEIGATHVVDRHLDSQAAFAEVSRITSAPIEVVYDAIGEPGTQNLGYDFLAPGGVLLIVLSESVDKAKLSPSKRIEHVYGVLDIPQNRAFGATLCSKLTVLLENRTIKPNRVKVLPNGLDGIIGGLEELKEGVSNVKLVAHPQEEV
ncbi:GroES-like protein [Laetiporus sulphureus 93-53]|uniref:GroES-like protein n=1 Tax=Laetiporus sulphureus 93-53 TaxID=1314785 RepID=A0A165B9M6_9APHY|nr:GroES-like protein [Laetiporus sulphureus 93-53]KZT00562.1 GroES-like protein [Laetiporus sulphureus 93-53]